MPGYSEYLVDAFFALQFRWNSAALAVTGMYYRGCAQSSSPSMLSFSFARVLKQVLIVKKSDLGILYTVTTGLNQMWIVKVAEQ